MHRFYLANVDFSRRQLIIDDMHEVHHIKDVLRLKAGDQISIFNGKNQEALVRIEKIVDQGIEVGVVSVKEGETASRCRIVLACAPPKKGKFELIIEKATELGVDEIIPLKTKRTEVIFTQDKGPAKLKRFEAVAINAAKQCGRRMVPIIKPMMTMSDMLSDLPQDGVALIPSLVDQSRHIRDVLSVSKPPAQLTILIGPEGDFTPDEVKLAINKGCIPVSLGQTVLKVETAAIFSCSIARFVYGH